MSPSRSRGHGLPRAATGCRSSSPVQLRSGDGEVTVAPHFITSQAVLGAKRHKYAGDVILGCARVTPLAENEINPER